MKGKLNLMMILAVVVVMTAAAPSASPSSSSWRPHVSLPLFDYNELIERQCLDKIQRVEEEARARERAAADASKCGSPGPPFVMREVAVSGSANVRDGRLDRVSFGVNYDVMLARDLCRDALDDDWTALPLVGPDWVVGAVDATVNGVSCRGIPGQCYVERNENTGVLLRLRHGAGNETDGSWDHVVVGFTVFAAGVTKTHRGNRHDTRIRLPHHLTQFDLAVHDDGGRRVLPRSVEVAVSEAHINVVQDNDDSGAALIQLGLPVTDTVELSWKMDADDGEPSDSADADGQQAAYFGVRSNTVVSIGDSLVRETTVMDFTYADMMELRALTFQLHSVPQVRLVRVLGLNVKSFELLTEEEEGDDGHVVRTVRVLFNAPFEVDVYELQIVTERPSHGDQVDVSRVQAVGAANQVGVVAVETTGDVEISVEQSDALAAVPSLHDAKSWLLEACSPTFAHSFAAADWRLLLGLAHHTPVTVLDTIIPTAHLATVASDTGALNKLSINLANSRRQFLDVVLPEHTVSVWAALVNGVAVSPSKTGDDGRRLKIPIKQTMSDTPGALSSVELIFLTSHDNLRDADGQYRAGTLTVATPLTDVPIEAVQVSVFLPDGLHVRNVSTSRLRPVRSFSLPRPEKIRATRKGRAVVPSDFDFSAAANQYVNVENLVKQGTVEVDIPLVGREHRFESLVVVNQSLSLDVHYQSPPIVKPKELSLFQHFLSIFERL